MGLYRVLLADDEEEIRNGIIRKIKWEENGFTLVGAAENGQEALELAEKLKPDVVMTDVKMPFMSGLELGEKLTERMPSTKLVLFSGFDDFEYAQQAIKLNATEYILKPIDSIELEALLQKIKKQIDTELNEKRNLNTLNEYYLKSLPILKEQFLIRLVSSKLSEKRAQELAEEFQEDLSAHFWVVAIVHGELNEETEDSNGNKQFSFKNQEELVPLSLKQIIDEMLSKEFRFRSFIYSDNVTVLVMMKENQKMFKLVDSINKLCKIAKRYLEIPVSAGIGASCNSLSEIRYSYQGAENALGYRVLMGDKAIYIDDMEPDFSIQLQFDEQDERELLNAIKLEPPEKIKKIVDKLVERFLNSRVPFNQHQIYMTEILSGLFKVVRNYKLDMEDVFGKEFKGYSHLSDFENLSELSNWFYEVCCKISMLIKRERMDTTKMLAERAKEFVQEHYSDSNVSVEMLCSFLHVSPAYFSTIFKKETGVSFITYLTEIRMEEAIKLLNTTDDKTYIISLKVGYTEPNYFSYVFKKHFGVSPSKYRGNKTI